MPRILVIDDSSTIRSAIKRILTGLSHEVSEAPDGAAALEAVKGDPNFAAILCDIDMPVMDGLTFLTALRTEPSLPQPPVIMCSTHNSFERIGDALGRGANEYIMKPFTQEIIAEKLASVGIG